MIPYPQTDQLHKEYLALDIDGDGDISEAELMALLKALKRKLNMSEKAIKNLVKDADRNGDGQIDFNEFLNLVENVEKRKIIYKSLVQRAGIRKAFEKYDTTGKGFLTRPEFQKALESKYEAILAPKQVTALMDRIDEDGSGKIEFDEFMKAFSYFPVSK